MFRDRMLGSIRDSSASGVFRIRPVNTAQGPAQVPCQAPRDQRGPPIASQLVPRTTMAPWWHTGSSHLVAISIVLAGKKWEREREKRNKSLRDVGRISGGALMLPQPALLTHNQLPHFLPADQAARLMHQGDGDPPLDTLRPPRPARKGQRLARSPGSEAGARQGATGSRGGNTWWSRKVPWHGMPPRWSTTAGM